MAADAPETPAPPAPTGGGGVDLYSPFFRKLEADRGLPPGVLSAMAEKESGGNALKRATDPKSSASGLFQITNATARDWGLSPEDRFDAVKSATAAADILARRADKVGPERAVGMHYGGPGTPWETPVGSSGLSPASYSADVFARARKYAPAAGEVGFAPPGFTDQGTAPPPPDHYDTRYQMRAPDGSVSTQVIRTDRPISTQELANHVAGQGGTFVGFPEAPPPPPEESAQPTLGERAQHVFLPHRSLISQAPSIGGAAVGGGVGGAVGALGGPLAPFTIPAGRIIGAGLGGAGGEALEIGGEKLFGLEPAEPGSAWQRIANAGIRSGSFEGVTAPVQYIARGIASAARPITEAARDLSGVLAQDLPAATKVVQAADGRFWNINRLLNDPAQLETFAGAPGSQDTLLRAWWQRVANLPGDQIKAAWETLKGTQQLGLAGGQRDAMQTVVDTVASGAPHPGLKATVASLAGGGAGLATGHPGLAAAAAIPAAEQTASAAVPWLAAPFLKSAGGSQVLASLPRIGEYVAPSLSLPAIGEVPVPYVSAAGQTLWSQPWSEQAPAANF